MKHDDSSIDQTLELTHSVFNARSKFLVEDHPDTLKAKERLASALNTKGRKADAGTIYRETLEASIGVFGKHNHRNSGILNKLAIYLRDKVKFEEAGWQSLEAFRLRKIKYGEAHPWTLDTMRTLVSILVVCHKSGADDMQLTEELCNSMPLLHKVVLEKNDPRMGENYMWLAEYQETRRNYHKAAIARRQEITIRRIAFGAEHELTKIAKESLSKLLEKKEEHQDADGMIREIIEERPETWPRDDWDDDLAKFATTLQVLGENDEASDKDFRIESESSDSE